MPVFRLLDKEISFPDPRLAEESGLLAIGGDLSPERLLAAYASGIFPWYSDAEPILWWSPDPRLTLFPTDLHVSRSLRKAIRTCGYVITLDTAFEEVVAACAATERPGQDGTWITDEMRAAYLDLHLAGHVHSVEAWKADELVGGAYGVSLGTCFFGESMFARHQDASKVAFVCLVEQLFKWGYTLVDCQVYTEHLSRFGAREIPREDFLKLVEEGVGGVGRIGDWRFDS